MKNCFKDWSQTRVKLQSEVTLSIRSGDVGSLLSKTSKEDTVENIRTVDTSQMIILL